MDAPSALAKRPLETRTTDAGLQIRIKKKTRTRMRRRENATRNH
jgi:hypothetical protein